MSKELEVEMVEEREISITKLEDSFSEFLIVVDTTTSKISTNINMDELNEIGDEILKAREYLISFASGEKKSTREKLYNQVGNLPLIGSWASKKAEEVQLQSLKDSNVKDVLQGIFDNFEIKKKRLVELTTLADTIRNSLLNSEKKLGEFIKDIDYILSTTTDPASKMRAYDMSIQAQSSEKIIKDQVHNKLHFIIEMMEALHLRMSKTLPSIKAQLINETSIAGMITSISDSVKMMDSLQELTNEISRTSTANIQGLIMEVSDQLTNGVDVDFYKKSAETNAAFQKTMNECTAKRIKATVDTYNELKDIGMDVSRQLENRVSAQCQALGINKQED